MIEVQASVREGRGDKDPIPVSYWKWDHSYFENFSIKKGSTPSNYTAWQHISDVLYSIITLKSPEIKSGGSV